MLRSIGISALLLTITFNLWAVPESEELGYGTRDTKLYYHFPPDPVNVRTLNFFLPVVHLSMPCFVPIEIKAAYNSYSGESSIFGKKWTFNHNIRVRDAITHFEVIEGDGFVNRYTREKNLEKATQALVQKIMIELKKKDVKEKTKKDESAYKAIEKKLKDDKAYREESARKLIKIARPLGPGDYHSLMRGQSKLVKRQDGSFLREFQNGSKEYFDPKGRLIRSEDRNGNHLSYVYQGEYLIRITDMCKRSVNFAYYKDAAKRGLVASVRDDLGRTVKYQYDSGRRLTTLTKSEDNSVVSYRYDKNGYMVEMSDSSKPNEKISLSYNERFEVTEQKGPGNRRTKYARTFVNDNPNHSITQIEKYKGDQLISREEHEFKIGEYEVVTIYGRGKQVSKKTTKKFSAATGYPESILDDKGNGDLFTYDKSTGNLLSRKSVPSGETTTFKYESRCNQVNQVTVAKLKKSLKVTTYQFDQRCNVIEATEVTDNKKTGKVKVSYTSHGKTKFLRDLINKIEIAFTYWKYGKPESITLRDVGTLLVKYKPAGGIRKVDTFPHGKGKERFKNQDKEAVQRKILQQVRGSLDSVLKYLRPAGLRIGL